MIIHERRSGERVTRELRYTRGTRDMTRSLSDAEFDSLRADEAIEEAAETPWVERNGAEHRLLRVVPHDVKKFLRLTI